jgi:hypothetical protein
LIVEEGDDQRDRNQGERQDCPPILYGLVSNKPSTATLPIAANAARQSAEA